MAKIPGTHRHASIASIPHSKEFKENYPKIFKTAKPDYGVWEVSRSGKLGKLLETFPNEYAANLYAEELRAKGQRVATGALA